VRQHRIMKTQGRPPPGSRLPGRLHRVQRHADNLQLLGRAARAADITEYGSMISPHLRRFSDEVFRRHRRATQDKHVRGEVVQKRGSRQRCGLRRYQSDHCAASTFNGFTQDGYG